MFEGFFTGEVILQGPLPQVNGSLHLHSDSYLKIFEFIIFIKKFSLKVHVSLGEYVPLGIYYRAYVCLSTVLKGKGKQFLKCKCNDIIMLYEGLNFQNYLHFDCCLTEK